MRLFGFVAQETLKIAAPGSEGQNRRGGVGIVGSSSEHKVARIFWREILSRLGRLAGTTSTNPDSCKLQVGSAAQRSHDSMALHRD